MRCEEGARGANVTVLLVCFLSVFVSAGLLLSFRLHAAGLESRMAETIGKIETCRTENVLMERKCTNLLSSDNVYVYAKEHFNMEIAPAESVIYVDAGDVTAARVSVASSAASEPSVFDRFNPFLKQAHANN